MVMPALAAFPSFRAGPKPPYLPIPVHLVPELWWMMHAPQTESKRQAFPVAGWKPQARITWPSRRSFPPVTLAAG